MLDVNIAGEKVYPVAEALSEHGVPFIVSTGYGVAGLDDAWKSHPVLQKPYQELDLARALTNVAEKRVSNRPPAGAPALALSARSAPRTEGDDPWDRIRINVSSYSSRASSTSGAGGLATTTETLINSA